MFVTVKRDKANSSRPASARPTGAPVPSPRKPQPLPRKRLRSGPKPVPRPRHLNTPPVTPVVVMRQHIDKENRPVSEIRYGCVCAAINITRSVV